MVKQKNTITNEIESRKQYSELQPRKLTFWSPKVMEDDIPFQLENFWVPFFLVVCIPSYSGSVFFFKRTNASRVLFLLVVKELWSPTFFCGVGSKIYWNETPVCACVCCKKGGQVVDETENLVSLWNKIWWISRWWFQIFFSFSPLFGEDSQFD